MNAGARNTEALKGWLPVEMILGPHEPLITWRDMRGVSLDEPFFHQTVARARERFGDHGECTTGLDELLLLGKHIEHLEPKGFIFHTSRCGSTLIANVLRAIPNSTVVAEAQPIYTALWLHHAAENAQRTHALMRGVVLKSLVTVMGQRRSAADQNYFVKLSHWDVLQIQQIKRIWPGVPWIFAFRDPVEVIVSNLRDSPEWISHDTAPRDAATKLGIDESVIRRMSREEICARMFSQLCNVAADAAGQETLFVNYDRLSEDTLHRIVNFFGIEPSASESKAINEVASVYSKDPQKSRFFEDDSSAKQRVASEAVRAMAEKYALSAYRRVSEIESAHWACEERITTPSLSRAESKAHQ